jgi:hypothetical protein
MSTFSQLVEEIGRLKQKLRVLEHVKDFVDDLDQFDREALDEVLLDLDELCVAPLVDRIGRIEMAKITRPRKRVAEQEDVKAKEEQAKSKGRKRKVR